MEAPDDIQRTPAEQNIWYQLATIHGVPRGPNDPIQVKNRITWNRTMATLVEQYDSEAKTKLQTLERQEWWSENEIEPFTKDETYANQKIRQISDHIELDDEIEIIIKNTIFKNNTIFDKFIFAFKIDISKSIFINIVSISDSIFLCKVYFDNVIFISDVNFTGSQFLEISHFENALFKNNAIFIMAHFHQYASLGGASFLGKTNFKNAIFESIAGFIEAKFVHSIFFNTTFSRDAHFEQVAFSGNADFEQAKFMSWANFELATFSERAIFNQVTFSHNASFEQTTFLKAADFSHAHFGNKITFVNTKMLNKTMFASTVFETYPAEFFGATLHEGTTWNRDRSAWPLPKEKEEAYKFVAAYERLKLEMDRLKKHEDEMDFFALELQSRRIEMGEYSPYGILIWLYGAFSDFGRSYVHPLKWIAAIVIAGFLILLFDAHQPDELLGKLALSAANTFALLGIRREFISHEVTDKLPGFFSLVAALQAVAGAFLTFLVGLGLRNKLRMK